MRRKPKDRPPSRSISRSRDEVTLDNVNRGIDGLVHYATDRIIQAELQEYLNLGPYVTRRKQLRDSLVKKLEAGASIEPGSHTAYLDEEERVQLSWRRIAAAIGQAMTLTLREQIEPITVHTLRVQPKIRLSANRGK